MSKHTFEERLVAGLLADGWHEVPASSRYRTFEKAGKPHVFVGSSGALRMGRTASSSRSVGDPQRQTTIYQAILALGTDKLENGALNELRARLAAKGAQS